MQVGQHQAVNGQPVLAEIICDFPCGFPSVDDGDHIFVMEQGGICIAHTELDIFRAVMRPYNQGNNQQQRAGQKKQTAALDGQEPHTANQNENPPQQRQQIGLLHPKVGEGQRV